MIQYCVLRNRLTTRTNKQTFLTYVKRFEIVTYESYLRVYKSRHRQYFNNIIKIFKNINAIIFLMHNAFFFYNTINK